VTGDERAKLLHAAEELAGSAEGLKALNERLDQFNAQIARLPPADQAGQNALRDSQLALLGEWGDSYSRVADDLERVGNAIRLRLTIAVDGEDVELRGDEQARAVRQRAARVRRDAVMAVASRVDGDFIKSRRIPAARVEEVRRLREEVLLLAGAGELPARNVANIGFVLYANHLLAVELAGTLLLVATVGAVAIAQRRGPAA
jgi:hypothetical protein